MISKSLSSHSHPMLSHFSTISPLKRTTKPQNKYLLTARHAQMQSQVHLLTQNHSLPAIPSQQATQPSIPSHKVLNAEDQLLKYKVKISKLKGQIVKNEAKVGLLEMGQLQKVVKMKIILEKDYQFNRKSTPAEIEMKSVIERLGDKQGKDHHIPQRKDKKRRIIGQNIEFVEKQAKRLVEVQKVKLQQILHTQESLDVLKQSLSAKIKSKPRVEETDCYRKGNGGQERVKELEKQKKRMLVDNCLFEGELTKVIKKTKQLQSKIEIKKEKIKQLAKIVEEAPQKQVVSNSKRQTAEPAEQTVMTDRTVQLVKEKQAIHSISLKLESELLQQSQRQKQLSKRKLQEYNKRKENHELQISRLKIQVEEEAKRIEAEMVQEKRRREQNELRIRREEERYEQLQKQLRQYESKEQQVMLLAGEVKKRQEEQELAEKMRQKQSLEKEMKAIEQKQEWVLKQYKQSNEALSFRIQKLRQKNLELQKSLDY